MITKEYIFNIKQQGQAHSARSGQAMLLTVLILSSTVLGLSAIGGYTMLIRLRASSDVINTTKAIYIADAGLECAAFSHFKKGGALDCSAGAYNQFSYNEGAPVAGAVYSTAYVAGPPAYIRSVGDFRNANRSFRMDF